MNALSHSRLTPVSSISHCLPRSLRVTSPPGRPILPVPHTDPPALRSDWLPPPSPAQLTGRSAHRSLEEHGALAGAVGTVTQHAIEQLEPPAGTDPCTSRCSGRTPDRSTPYGSSLWTTQGVRWVSGWQMGVMVSGVSDGCQMTSGSVSPRQLAPPSGDGMGWARNVKWCLYTL